MKNPWDAIIENQKKVLDFWSGMSEQMAAATSSNGNGKKTDAGNEMFSKWMEQQKTIWDQMTKSAVNPQDALAHMPDQLKQWTEMQQQFTEQYMTLYKENALKMGLPMPQMDMGAFMPNRIMEENFKNWKNWSQGGDKWMRDQMMGKLPFNMQPHYANFLEFFDDVHRYWEPFSRMIQNGIFDKEMVEKYFAREAYLKVVNQLMGFKPIGNVTELVDSVNGYFDKMLNQFGDETSKWNTVSETWRSKMGDFFSGSHVPLLQFGNDINNRLRDQLTPFFNISAQGRQTEIAKLLRDIQFGYISFILKTSELQTKVYDAGQFVLPDLLRTYYEEYQKTKETPDFQAFLHKYINELEESILTVLNADEYSKLQSEIAGLGASIKSMSDKAGELMLADLPFLTRSEGDDFAKEAAAMRKKVRSLEQRIEALENLLHAKADEEKSASKTKRSTVKS